MALGNKKGPLEEGPVTGRGYGINPDANLPKKGYGGLGGGQGYGPRATGVYGRIRDWYRRGIEKVSSLFGGGGLEKKLVPET